LKRKIKALLIDLKGVDYQEGKKFLALYFFYSVFKKKLTFLHSLLF